MNPNRVRYSASITNLFLQFEVQKWKFFHTGLILDAVIWNFPIVVRGMIETVRHAQLDGWLAMFV